MTERLGYLHPDFQEKRSKPPFQCSIHMGRHSVNVFSEMSHFLPYLEGLGTDYISSFPGWKVARGPTSSAYSIVYYPNHKPFFYYDEGIKTFFASGKSEDFESGQVLAYLCFWMMEAQRQAESMFTMHSSALAMKDSGILLLGHSGAGKTSVLLGLGLRYNCEVVSNDLTTLAHSIEQQQMFLVDGTKEIRLRFASIKTRFPELIGLFPQKAGSPWETKVTINPEKIGMESATESKRLKAAFIIHLDQQEDFPLSVYQASGIAVRYTLYEDMSRIIRGNAISLFGADDKILGYIPSLDNPDLHRKRVAAIESLVSEIGIWNVSGGNLNNICQAILEITKT